MLLYLEARSERGKPVIKSGNEYIEIGIKGSNRSNIYEICVEVREYEISMTVNNRITGEKEIFSVPIE